MSFGWNDFQGVNAALVAELYESYRRDPESVDAATREFFAGNPPPVSTRDTEPESPAPRGSTDSRQMRLALSAFNLAQSIRRYGHPAAGIGPLGSRPLGDPTLEPETHGLSALDLEALPAELIFGPVSAGARNMAEVVDRLRAIYCSTT